MAQRRGTDPLIGLGLSAALVILLAYLQRGRGKANAPLIPDAVENQIDRVVAALNRTFGHQWVNSALDTLQGRLEQALPGMNHVLSAVYWAERTLGPGKGGAKRQAAYQRVHR